MRKFALIRGGVFLVRHSLGEGGFRNALKKVNHKSGGTSNGYRVSTNNKESWSEACPLPVCGGRKPLREINHLPNQPIITNYAKQSQFAGCSNERKFCYNKVL